MAAGGVPRAAGLQSAQIVAQADGLRILLGSESLSI